MATDQRTPRPRPKPPAIPGIKPAAEVEPLWKLSDIARYINASRSTIERERAAGRLPRPDLIVGRRSPRWRPETIHRWIEQQAKGRGVAR